MWTHARPLPRVLAGGRSSSAAVPAFTDEWYGHVGVTLFMAATVAFTTSLAIPSSFIFFILGVSSLTVAVVGSVLPRAPGGVFAAAAYVIGATVAVAFLANWTGMLFDLITPLTGRMGILVPGDAVVGAVAAILLSFATLSVVPLPLRHRNGARTVARAFGVIGVLAIALAVLVVAPYDFAHPKRVTAQHLIDTTTNTYGHERCGVGRAGF